MNEIQGRESIETEADDTEDNDEQSGLGSLINCGWGQIMIGAILLTLMFFVAVIIDMGAASQLSH